jgi:hypothetical protein
VEFGGGGGETAAAFGGEAVDSAAWAATGGGGVFPLAGDELGGFETIEGGVEGAFF